MNQINRTTIELIGGNQTFAMCVAHSNRKWISYDDNTITISFRFGRNKSKANLVRFIYVPGKDLYTVEFVRAKFGNWTIPSSEVVHSYENIYGEDLRGTFERFTGLRTSLTRVYA